MDNGMGRSRVRSQRSFPPHSDLIRPDVIEQNSEADSRPKKKEEDME